MFSRGLWLENHLIGGGEEVISIVEGEVHFETREKMLPIY